MSTSIRDLITAANDELDSIRTRDARSRGGVSGAVEALTTISAAAPILTRLRRDGLQLDVDGIREHAVTALATATRTVATASRGLPDGRAALLLGAAGDVIGTLRHDTGREDRWAIALAVGDTVRRASALYTAAGPSAPNRHVDWSRRAAVLLTRLGAEHPPEPRHLIGQDRPVPDPIFHGAATPLAAAAQAVDNVTHLLRRSTEPLALYQLKATTLMAQTAARFLSAVAAGADPGSDAGWTRASHSWGLVRRDIGVFHDGQLVGRDGGDQLPGWAARAHDNITRALGPADQIIGRTVAAIGPTDAKHLVEIAQQLPTIAAVLRGRLVDVDGRVFARVADLPQQDRRITEQVRRLPVVADGPDFAAAHTALRTAELSSARLASELTSRLATATSRTHLVTDVVLVGAHRNPSQRPAPTSAQIRPSRPDRTRHPAANHEHLPRPDR